MYSLYTWPTAKRWFSSALPSRGFRRISRHSSGRFPGPVLLLRLQKSPVSAIPPHQHAQLLYHARTEEVNGVVSPDLLQQSFHRICCNCRFTGFAATVNMSSTGYTHKATRKSRKGRKFSKQMQSCFTGSGNNIMSVWQSGAAGRCLRLSKNPGEVSEEPQLLRLSFVSAGSAG